MKLRVTVEGKAYDVVVDVLEDDPVAPSAAASGMSGRARALGGRAAMPIAERETAARAESNGTLKGAERSGAERPGAEKSDPGVVVDISLSIAGTITSVRAKVGDAVRPHEAIMAFAASSALTGGGATGNGLVGAVHVPSAGVITEVLVRQGDTITPNQVLARMRVRKPAG